MPGSNQLRDTATGYHENEGSDKRLDLQNRNQNTVPQARQHADTECGQQYHRQAVALHGQRGGHGTGNRHNGPDGQIDAAGGNHQRHADRQQGHRRGTVKDIDGTAEQAAILHHYLEKVAGYQTVYQQHQHQRGYLRHAL
ncbi:hypothetical protein OS31_39200 [Dickeya oryzae]